MAEHDGAHRRARPLLIYVLALMVVPMLGFSLLAASSIRSSSRAASAASEFTTELGIRTAALKVVTPVQVERVGLSSIAFLRMLGVSPQVSTVLIGIDLEEMAATAEVAADEAIVVLRSRLSAADRSADVRELDALVAELGRWRETDLATQAQLTEFDSTVRGLLSLSQRIVAVPLFADASTVALTRELEATADIVISAQLETQTLLSTMVPDGAADVPFRVAEATHLDRLATSAGVVDEARLAALVEARRSVPQAPQELYDFEALEAEDLRDGLETAVTAGQAAMSRIEYLSAVSDFARSTGADLSAEAEVIASEAAESRTMTILAVVAISMLSIAFCGLVIRWLLRPLHRLRDAARQIGDGDLRVDELPLEGPRETRDVTAAINDMSMTLARIDQYMNALAGGGDQQLGADDLPGPVGASVRHSVERVHELTSRLRESETALAHLARVDALTGLPNRLAVFEHLDRHVADVASRDNAPRLGLMFLDVDGFKSVNDTHGHGAGDEVLRVLANRLACEVRGSDVVARLGGDEFLVVVHAGLDEDGLRRLGERLIRSIEQPCEVGDQMFVLSASIGVTTYRPGDDALALIERADAAVYQAKRRGRRRVEVFDEQLQERVGRDAEVELALRRAIAGDELLLYLQPLADGRTGDVWGAEGLVRWRRGDGSLTPPGDFIPVAERSGLIFELERWVLFEAARIMRRWSELGHHELRLAINVSGRHLLDGDFISLLDEAFADQPEAFSRLELELTESHLLDDVDRAIDVLSAIRRRGVLVAIDDFGTGYSSMTYLQRLPVDVVKIDRSFVAKLPDDSFGNTVVEAVIAIAHSLDLEVVAEGVEDGQQLAAVLRHGVSRVQGYHLAMPAPLDDAERVLFHGPMVDVEASPPVRLSPSEPSRAPTR